MAFQITKTGMVAALAGALLLGWIGFHPHRQAQLEELTPPMRDWLRQQPETWRSGSLVHTRLEAPVHIVMDGRRSASAIFKTTPQAAPEPEAFQ